MGLQPTFGLKTNRLQRDGIGFGVFLGEKFREGQNVGRAFSQRGQSQVYDVQAVEQILAECALLDGLYQIAVRGRQHPYIDWHRL